VINIVRLLLGLALLLLAPLAAGQSTLGELLDTGAQKLSAEEFRRDIVQRSIVGPTPAGFAIEFMYVANGSIVGMGNMVAAQSQITSTSFGGEWTIDDAGRICASLRTSGSGSTFGGSSAVLPPRCQTWFKLGDAYFISDSDSDRRAKVLRRTIMPSSNVAPQNNLGALLDAGAKRVSAEEFRQDVVKRTLVGPTSIGGKMEVVYAADGSLRGQENIPTRPISGKWTIDESARICTSVMRIGALNLPNRCEYWFKLGEIYYVSESDTDRQAYVFPRTPNP
jgi:hypothetical protein